MKRIFGLLLLALAIAWPAAATTLIGTIKRPDGSNLNGRIRLTLSHPAHDTVAGTVVVPTPVTFQVASGALPPAAAVTGNDILEPQNTYYWTEYFDSAGARVMQNAFYIAGASFDIGSARPTTTTTSNIFYANVDSNVRADLASAASGKGDDLVTFRSALAGSVARTVGSKLAETVSVRDFGALGNDSHDDKPAIDAALAASCRLYLPAGTYKYNGTMSAFYNVTCASVGRYLYGDGSGASIIHFTDSTVTSGVEISGTNYMINVRVEGLLFKGPGQHTGTVNGFYVHTNSTANYNWAFRDVGFTDWSGNGYDNFKTFQQAYYGVWARNIGADGIVLGGDQNLTFINSGEFNMNIDGWSWWFQGSGGFLQNLNCGDVGNGARFGRAPTDPRGESHSSVVIMGLNVEGVRNGGIPIKFEKYSNFQFATSLNVYAEDGVTVPYGVYWEFMGIQGTLAMPVSFATYGSGSFTNKYYVNDGDPAYSGLIINGPSQDAYFNATGKQYIASIRPFAGNVTLDRPILARDNTADSGVNVTVQASGTTGAPHFAIKGGAFSTGFYFRRVEAADNAGNAAWAVGENGESLGTVGLYTGTSLTKRFSCKDSTGTCETVGGLGGGVTAPVKGLGTSFVVFADIDAGGSLASANSGTVVWCENCSVTTPCTGGGAGAWAFRAAGAWKCPF